MDYSSAASPTTRTRSPMVATSWLADRLTATGLVLVDASVLPPIPGGDGYPLSGRGDYFVEGHIPGAVFADMIKVFSDQDGEYPFHAPGVDAFEDAAGSLGIDNSSTVVIYDNQQGQWAARLWWLFRTFGYDRVGVLDGGITKWRSENRPIQTGYVAPIDATFVASPRPDLWADRAYLEAIVAGELEAALVCGLPRDEYLGATGGRSRGGHIPGSISAPNADMIDPETNELISSPELTKMLSGALPYDRVVVYCGGGIASALDALALTMLGHRNVAIYDNSMMEWATHDDLPLVSVG
ncbi:sulfurtransferase [Naasia lichenicola]|uniref:Sulfurtransferase n=1 Tax=Naasia lichenicola TaxID=2565933 RepID=A0A4S4FII7_9MICO|nr:rhodanese-like domain-containing protein [Naasia lichenicola]THG30163.1 sulfurtransferase [Naasia lichenicola]